MNSRKEIDEIFEKPDNKQIDDDDANTTNKPFATKENILKAKQGGNSLNKVREYYTVTKEMEAYYESLSN